MNDKTDTRNLLLSGRELSRRGFLKATGYTTGSVVVGLVLPGGAALGQQTHGSGGTELNAYVAIAPDNTVSIVVPGAELGQGVYTALPKIVAEELEADWDKVTVRLATADAAYDHPRKKRQSTGNSDAVMGYFDALRSVGAATREVLISAAASRWQVARDTCEARDSFIHHAASGHSLSYGALAAEASALPVPAAPPLKPREQFRLLGKSAPRKDGLAKVTGQAEYGADVRLPGQLFASIRTSPTFGGRLKPLADTDLPRGVEKIVELDDGVAIVAKTFWQAESALRNLKLSFDGPDDASWDSERVSATLHDALDNGDPKPFPRARGDAPAVLAEATDTFEAVYEVPFLAHVCMEPMTATAEVTAERCRIWAPHQQQGAARAMAAELTGLPLEQVSLQGTFCGGGFGRKWELDFVRQAVQVAMQTDGRPVTLIWTREEDVQHDFYRPAVASRARAVLGGDGMPLALHSRSAGPSVLSFQKRPLRIPDPLLVSNAINPLYGIPNTLIELAEVETPVPVGFWRSVSQSHNGFIGESVIDELAHRGGHDPLEFRLKLLGDNARARTVLEEAAGMAGWEQPLARNKGRGIAFSSAFGSLNAQIADVTVDGDRLHVDRVVCVFDCGFAIDPDTVRAQMESGIIDGLSAALFSKITIANGAVEQSNFHDYRFLRLAEAPEIDVHLVDSGGPIGGVGEAGLPAIAPALANAIFSATRRRIRRLPLADAGLRLA